ncbi:MAG: hypothetical protein Fur0018_18550 [Anaerolineales bacterium]
MPPDDFPLPEPPQEMRPWEQRSSTGGGFPSDASPDETRQPPEKLCAQLQPHELGVAIADQTDLAHYAVPDNYQPATGDETLTLGENAEIWTHFFDEDLYDTRRLTLEQVHLFAWFPLSLGRYHTAQAAFQRQQALQAMFRTPDGRAYFTPGGKASMIAGGLGAVRLRPRKLVGT